MDYFHSGTKPQAKAKGRDEVNLSKLYNTHKQYRANMTKLLNDWYYGMADEFWDHISNSSTVYNLSHIDFTQARELYDDIPTKFNRPKRCSDQTKPSAFDINDNNILLDPKGEYPLEEFGSCTEKNFATGAAPVTWGVVATLAMIAACL